MKFNKQFIFIFILVATSIIAAKPYKGAELYSNEWIKYGKFEIRMKTIYGSGCISAFFTYFDSSYISGNVWREIDIEVFGKSHNSFQSNIITGKLEKKTMSEDVHTIPNVTLDNEFHTYTLEWTPDYIAWYFDGKELRKTTGQQVIDCREKEQSYRMNAWISDVPEWVGAFNPSILPVYQIVNWIKFYKYTPSNPVNGSPFTLSWIDHFTTFNSTRWGKANWTFDGNMVDFLPANVVCKNGYLILCITDSVKTGFTGTLVPDPQDQSSVIPTANTLSIAKKEQPYKSVLFNSSPINGLTKLYTLTGQTARLNMNDNMPPTNISRGCYIFGQQNSR
jgi:hypothetical protein